MNFKISIILIKPFLFIGLACFFVYFFLTVIPNYLGCLTPENLCVTGVNKASDVVAITVSLVSLVFVLGAYESWRKQKSSEILAKHAEKIHVQLKDISENANDLLKKIEVGTVNDFTSTNEYLKFIFMHSKVNDELKILSSLLVEEQSSHAKLFKSFHDEYELITQKLGWIDIYKDLPFNDKSVLQTLIFQQNLVTPTNINEFNSNLDVGLALLVKIILHKL